MVGKKEEEQTDEDAEGREMSGKRKKKRPEMNKAQKRHEVQSDFNETGAPPGAHSASLQTSKDRTHTHTHTQLVSHDL